MTKSNVRRVVVLAIGALLVLGLSATTATAAPVLHSAPAKPSAQTTSCQPASALTQAERDALPSLRVCRGHAGSASAGKASRVVQPDVFSGNINVTTSVAAFNGDFQFNSAYEVEMTGVALRDVNCDGRSVYADLYDTNGFIAEYVNSLGCNNTETYDNAYFFDNDGVKQIWFRIYACNSTSCSSWVDTNHYSNSYWP